MRALVVYESMFGNTRAVAEAIAAGLGGPEVARTCPVSAAREVDLNEYDLLVVGGPTHVHGMSRAVSRRAAADNATAAMTAGREGPELDPQAKVTSGLREWLTWLREQPPLEGQRLAAAFDTRVEASPLLTGHASKGIGKQLTRSGYALAAEPHSFLVTKEPQLVPHEVDRARNWGKALSSRVLRAPTP